METLGKRTLSIAFHESLQMAFWSVTQQFPVEAEVKTIKQKREFGGHSGKLQGRSTDARQHRWRWRLMTWHNAGCKGGVSLGY